MNGKDPIVAAVARLISESETCLRDSVQAQVNESETHMRDFVHARIHESETRMLTAFHKFAERQDARWTAARILATQTRVEELRDEIRIRLAGLERKQPPPPAP